MMAQSVLLFKRLAAFAGVSWQAEVVNFACISAVLNHRLPVASATLNLDRPRGLRPALVNAWDQSRPVTSQGRPRSRSSKERLLIGPVFILQPRNFANVAGTMSGAQSDNDFVQIIYHDTEPVIALAYP